MCQHTDTLHCNANLETNRYEKEHSNLLQILSEYINHYDEYLIALGVHSAKIKKCFKADHNALSEHFYNIYLYMCL
jgi:hypothetical protein